MISNIITAHTDTFSSLAVLDPTSKFEYFRKYWGEELLDDVKTTVQSIVRSLIDLMLFIFLVCDQFIERHKSLHGNNSANANLGARRSSKRPRRRNSDDTDSESEAETAVDPNNPWRTEWNLYLQIHEIVPEGMSMVTWWGV